MSFGGDFIKYQIIRELSEAISPKVISGKKIICFMLIKDSEYKQWLGELKQRIRH